MQNDTFATVIVVGCGSIGLPVAAAFAASGIAVLGHDTDDGHLERIQAGTAGLTESDLATAIWTACDAGLLQFSPNLPRRPGPILGVTPDRCAYVIAVPTPWQNEAGFDDRPLEAAVAAVFAVARPGDAICIRSTVPVGTTASIAARATAAGLGIDVVSTPDRSIEGHSFREQFGVPHLIGSDDPAAGRRVAGLFGLLGQTVVCDESRQAEAAKLLCNVTRDVVFALANETARLCDALGVDGRAVCDAARHGYPRFALPRPGPVGGPCLAKDTHLLLASPGIPDSTLIRSARAANGGIAARVARSIAKHVAAVPSPVVALLGIAFKGHPPVADLRGSAALDIARRLRQGPSIRMMAWDPVAGAPALRREGLVPAQTPDVAAFGAAAIVLANDHPALVALDLDRLAEVAHPQALIYDLCGQAYGRKVALRPGQTLRILGGGQTVGAPAQVFA